MAVTVKPPEPVEPEPDEPDEFISAAAALTAETDDAFLALKCVEVAGGLMPPGQRGAQLDLVLRDARTLFAEVTGGRPWPPKPEHSA